MIITQNLTIWLDLENRIVRFPNPFYPLFEVDIDR